MSGEPRSIGRPPGRLPCGGRFGSARCTFGTGRCPDMPGRWGACRNQRFLRDMNVDVPLADSRRIEVLANGLPLWQGAQVAVDTTCVSPVSRDGSARAGADRVPGKPRRTTRLRAKGGGHAREKAAFPTSLRRGLAEQPIHNHRQGVSHEVLGECPPKMPKVCSYA